jgi:RNA polymerase sigma factor (sigma-70 family)
MRNAMVYVVDDDSGIRESLCWLLHTVGLAATAFTNANDFLNSIRPEGPSCLILDVRMPGKSGLELLEEMSRRNLRLPVILVTAYADVPMAVRAMKSGAVEFIEKPFNGQNLLEKVQKAIRDDAERLGRDAAHQSVRSRLDNLTEKEREVLRMIQEGRPNKEIANLLAITPRAVEMRRAGLMKKLKARSLPELLRLTLRSEPNPMHHAPSNPD